ncbi:hypothetical protein ACQP3D_29430, partial [Escherichia coli]
VGGLQTVTNMNPSGIFLPHPHMSYICTKKSFLEEKTGSHILVNSNPLSSYQRIKKKHKKTSNVQPTPKC